MWDEPVWGLSGVWEMWGVWGALHKGVKEIIPQTLKKIISIISKIKFILTLTGLT
ncbi:MAG: hypothetical protein F6K40_35330 [Okeania sp. SIO3I5]|uniref:hypothetical protein n=1 Tax=Okeania sp. SIO3I5 TaxID=2607805 RepID=UPI0013BC6C53|nr:hypothetical protein [Okeania sp. SIO3I5]NEQ41190.1 hypothetical protein [Okeania sp. SIO3I5]